MKENENFHDNYGYHREIIVERQMMKIKEKDVKKYLDYKQKMQGKLLILEKELEMTKQNLKKTKSILENTLNSKESLIQKNEELLNSLDKLLKENQELKFRKSTVEKRLKIIYEENKKLKQKLFSETKEKSK